MFFIFIIVDGCLFILLIIFLVGAIGRVAESVIIIVAKGDFVI